jgi:ribonuclease HI
MCHNSIPTLSLLHHRKITPSATCPRCGIFDETIFHCIRDCSLSRNIWQHIGFTEHSFYSSISIEDWIKNGLKGNLASLFAAGLWWIWRSRNALCLSNETITLPRLAFQINASVDDINLCFNSTTTGPASDRYVRWNSNNFSCAIINVDGSCIGSPARAGFGGLIRNGGGLYLTGFSGFIPHTTDILLAELTAILHGISIAKDMGITDMALYSDSLLSISLISGSCSKFHVHAVLIQDIKDLLSTVNYSLNHTLREANQCADYFAKQGASIDDGLLIYTQPPDDLRTCLKNDASGTLYLRA